MRTTLTLDDALAHDLRQRARASGKTFRQVVDETLRSGLQQSPPACAYRLQSAALGLPAPGLDMRKSVQLCAALDDAALLAGSGLQR